MSTTFETKRVSARQALMKICAHASVDEMKSALAGISPQPTVTDLRVPEIGMVMLRGRVGGNGAPFNLGEATVSRAAVKLDSGEVGYAYLLGRNRERARLAAIIDALGQRSADRARLDAAFVAQVTARIARTADTSRQRTAATRVNFFTLVRGED